MLNIFSCENDVIHDGTILISSQSRTYIFSRCTIAFTAFCFWKMNVECLQFD
jgi:hypothetical protein